MLSYKDRTFCEYYKDCSKGSHCDRALTTNVKMKAGEWWAWIMKDKGMGDAPIAVYADKPDCFKTKESDN